MAGLGLLPRGRGGCLRGRRGDVDGLVGADAVWTAGEPPYESGRAGGGGSAGRMMTAASAELALRLVAVHSRAARLPGPDEIRALESGVLAKPRRTMTSAEIRALAAEAIASLHEPIPAFQRARNSCPAA